MTENELNKLLHFASNIKQLDWTDDEKKKLPEKYTNLMVHIALEKADAVKDETAFSAILYGDGKYRTLVLKKHIEYTAPVFGWNYA